MPRVGLGEGRVRRECLCGRSARAPPTGSLKVIQGQVETVRSSANLRFRIPERPARLGGRLSPAALRCEHNPALSCLSRTLTGRCFKTASAVAAPKASPPLPSASLPCAGLLLGLGHVRPVQEAAGTSRAGCAPSRVRSATSPVPVLSFLLHAGGKCCGCSREGVGRGCLVKGHRDGNRRLKERK